MKINLHDNNGAQKGSVTLCDDLFVDKVNSDLIQKAVVMRLANGRRSIAHTLSRGEVAYSTAKLFRQKGTGRARRGARSTNLLRGGGVVHGPRNNRNYQISMSKKERLAAFKSALSLKANDQAIFAWEGMNDTVPSTKSFIKIGKNFPTGKKLLLVIAEPNETLHKSVRNIPNINIILARYLNPYDILHADQICLLTDAISNLEKTFIESPKS